MNEAITSYVGLDIHKDSIAIAIARAGRTAPRFVGTIDPSPSQLCKTLRRQHCSREHTLLTVTLNPERESLMSAALQSEIRAAAAA